VRLDLGIPLTSVAPPRSGDLHPNDLRSLPASPVWRILVDEAGRKFGPEAARTDASDTQLGRIVAVAIPGESPALPGLREGWHATEQENPDEIDKVVQQVLDSPVGVFGIKASDLPETPGDRWMDGVALVVDWLLRLLPLAESGDTRIEVLVEKRNEFRPGVSWKIVERECMRRLALAYPGRAARIDLSISIIGKEGSPYNGYPDAIAYTWAGGNGFSRERLRASGLVGPCLMEFESPRRFLAMFDAFDQGVTLREDFWWHIVASPETGSPASLVSTFLERVGEECRRNPAHWRKFLAETRRQMALGAVDIMRLADAVDWLQRHQPAEADLPALMRLSWLTVKLARSNHFGRTETEWAAELESLAASLLEEDAPRVCHADLHLAVAATNRFDFSGASRSLERWENLPPMVPGIRFWGRVQSSLGQHAAFLGRHREALRLFDSALAAFAKLSDPAVRRQESAQTACYKAIAMMDTPDANPDEIRRAVAAVTGEPNAELARRFASNTAPTDRYAHHLLLRWLATGADPELARAYLDAKPAWQSGQGHPWPLVELYRAVLLAMAGARIAFSADQGPVVRLIGACCRAFAHAWGAPWPSEHSAAELDALRQAIPAAGERIDAIAAFLENPGDPLAMIKEVLSFNFR
jgi:hypothetical protein